MSKDTLVCFPCLGNSNYPEWAMCMEATLTKKGLWSVIEVLVGKVKSDSLEKMKAERDNLIARQDVMKMAEAQAELILQVEDRQLSHMTACDPMVIGRTCTGCIKLLVLQQVLLCARSF